MVRHPRTASERLLVWYDAIVPVEAARSELRCDQHSTNRITLPLCRFASALTTVDADGADKGNAVKVRRSRLGSIHDSTIHWLHGRDGRICLSHLRPGNLPSLEHHFGLDAKVFRLVQYQISEFAYLDGTHDVRHAVDNGWVDRVLQGSKRNGQWRYVREKCYPAAAVPAD